MMHIYHYYAINYAINFFTTQIIYYLPIILLLPGIINYIL